MKRCAELGIKLAIKNDDDRLLVDAPKGSLTTELRDAISERNKDLIAILKTRDQTSGRVQAYTSTFPGSAPEKNAKPNRPESSSVIQEQALALTNTHAHAIAEELGAEEANCLVEDDSTPQHAARLSVAQYQQPAKEIDVVQAEKGIVPTEDEAWIPSEVLNRLSSSDAVEREAALAEVVQIGGEDAFRCISKAFDDQVVEVRNAAARALYMLRLDHAATFTRALREGAPERRRHIGQALAGSGLASDAVGNLTGESREKTYDASSLLFLMAKAGEVQPLMQAIEECPNIEVRIAVVKLLSLSGQREIIPAFRRLALRGSLPSEVRSAVKEAIYQISTQVRESATSAAW